MRGVLSALGAGLALAACGGRDPHPVAGAGARVQLSFLVGGGSSKKAVGLLYAVLLGTLVGGCGISQRMQAREQAKQLAAQSDAAVADCNARIPSGNAKTIVSRMQCLNDAMAIRMPLFGNDQDLAQAFMAYRMAIAEQVQNGKMSVAEGGAAVTEKWSQEVSESQRRRNASLSLAAQQDAAAAQQSAAAASWASQRPVTCMHTGTMTTCN